MDKHGEVLKKLFSINPYSLYTHQKKELLITGLISLTEYHSINNWNYRNILNSIDYKDKSVEDLQDLPLLPVRIFKEIDLVTNPADRTIRSINSSGTSGQSKSRIHIDTETSIFQSRALVKIVSHYVGMQRVPMLVIDSPNTIKDRLAFSARAAGIIGFSKFASNVTYALDENMSPNWQSIQEFEAQNEEKSPLIFGFTSISWLNLLKHMEAANLRYQFNGGIFFHGGGWKKVTENDELSRDTFKVKVRDYLGIEQVHDYYGMAEQTGSILVECEMGYMHTSVFSEVVIRNPLSHEVSEVNEVGLIETFSLLPKSYPGHVLLTEDLGRKIGTDDCGCGKLGTYFLIEGRIKRAEIRGCSDTYQLQ
jgi:phenylacetate-coenzyme A ligase PaaK-like adenylate-forming protein